MIKIKNIISEYSKDELYGGNVSNRSIQVSDEEIDNFLKTKSEYLKNVKRGYTVIGRGSYANKYNLSYKISPSNHTRISKNTFNYYTLMIDNSEYWSKYPKRSQSIICSFGIENSASYAHSDFPHIVMPITDGKIGVCPSQDMWISFIHSLDDMDLNDFNLQLRSIMQDVSNKLDVDLQLRITKYEDLLYAFNLIDKNKDAIKYKLNFSDSRQLFGKYLYGNVPLIKYLNDLLEPNKNGFTLIDSFYNNELINENDNEVWTDADCYLISYDKFMGALKNV